MNTALWIIQILLALMFPLHGYMMMTLPKNAMPYMRAIPPLPRNLIGILELLAGPGLILPALTGILPVLTPLAAAGLVILMIGAAVFHIPRREYSTIVFNLVLLALAAFVAYGRWTLAPL